MRTYSEIHTADLRLLILQVLSVGGADTSAGVVKAAVVSASESVHQPSGELLRSELLWLAERGLVTARTIGGSVEAATITERGADVAAGRLRLSGVAWPVAH